MRRTYIFPDSKMNYQQVLLSTIIIVEKCTLKKLERLWPPQPPSEWKLTAIDIGVDKLSGAPRLDDDHPL
jgi:hypothetical protein